MKSCLLCISKSRWKTMKKSLFFFNCVFIGKQNFLGAIAAILMCQFKTTDSLIRKILYNEYSDIYIKTMLFFPLF